jgi:hypothetical protein
VEVALLGAALTGLLPHAAQFTVPMFDKIGFDMDHIGRAREIATIEEKARAEYAKAGMKVNIAVWNMHLRESHDFHDILDSALHPMGRGGGFRIVVFCGAGYIKNEGALGLDNWHFSGNQVQRENTATFRRACKPPKGTASETKPDYQFQDWEWYKNLWSHMGMGGHVRPELR